MGTRPKHNGSRREKSKTRVCFFFFFIIIKTNSSLVWNFYYLEGRGGGKNCFVNERARRERERGGGGGEILGVIRRTMTDGTRYIERNKRNEASPRKRMKMWKNIFEDFATALPGNHSKIA